MGSDNIKISVIIPTHNTWRYLAGAINSVLASSFTNFEVIVVDDGSTDGTGQELRDSNIWSKVKYLHKSNGGLASARNLGIRHAHGEYLVFLDSDDIVLPTKLAAQSRYLDEHGEVDVVYSKSMCFVDQQPDQEFSPDFPCFHGDVLGNLLLGNFIHVNAAMVRRATVERVGLFDETFRELEDWDLWLRISARGSRFAFFDEVLSKVRVRRGSMTSDQGRMARSMIRVLTKFVGQAEIFPLTTSITMQAYYALFIYRSNLDAYSKYLLDLIAVSRQLGWPFVPRAIWLAARQPFRQLYQSKPSFQKKLEAIWESH